MHKKPIKVLLVEDDPSQAALLRQRLSRIKKPVFHVTCVDRLSMTINHLENEIVDIIILDLMLPDSQNLNTLDAIHRKIPKVPIVILSSLDDEELAIKAVQAGAQDYLVKGQFDYTLLARVLPYAIERNKMRVELQWHTQELAASEKRFRIVIENVTDGIIIVNKKNKVCFVNPAAEALFDQKRNDLLNRPFKFPIAPNRTTELNIILKGKETKIAEMKVEEIVWEGEKVYLASLRNITERKQSEETLRAANRKLKKLNQMKSDFVSMVSHELKTPLTCIGNSIEILAASKTGDLNNNQEHLLAIAARNIDRLTNLLDELLDLSKIEAGKTDLKYSETDLENMIQHVVATFKSQAENNSLKLNGHCAKTLSKIYTDPNRLEQILCNLVSNAIKYSPDGGNIILSAQHNADTIEISVTDRGLGLSPEEQKLVFEQFYQVGENLNRSSNGFGLGLYITNKFVKELGGQISVESQLGKGSRFSVTLPAISAQMRDIVNSEVEIRKYMHQSSFSLLMVELNSKDTFNGNKPQPQTNARLLNQLMETTKKTFSRENDCIIPQPAFERFILILGGTKISGAKFAAEKLKTAVMQSAIDFKDVTVSSPKIIGPVAYPDDGSTLSELINTAHENNNLTKGITL